MDVAQFINDFGFPVVAVVGLGYFIYYVWKYIKNPNRPSTR